MFQIFKQNTMLIGLLDRFIISIMVRKSNTSSLCFFQRSIKMTMPFASWQAFPLNANSRSTVDKLNKNQKCFKFLNKAQC